MKQLCIVFTILCAVCVAALPLAGIFGGLPFAGIALISAGIFFFLMLACKSRQLAIEQKQNEQPVGDFFHPIPNPTQAANEKQETNKDGQ